MRLGWISLAAGIAAAALGCRSIHTPGEGPEPGRGTVGMEEITIEIKGMG